MSRRVLDVGNCIADHTAIKRLIEVEFGAEVRRTHGEADTLQALQDEQYDLVLVNRKWDRGAGDGMSLVQRLKNAPQLAAIPVMLVTDFEHYQQQAVAAGAEWGFGKSQLKSPETRTKLARFLSAAAWA